MGRNNEMSTFEAAAELGVSIRTVQQWMEKGELTGRKTPGGHRRVNADQVLELSAKRIRDKATSGTAVCKVLIIEDDPDVCHLYELMSRSWKVPTALHFEHDGLKGLIAMGEFQPDFVIVDLNIPKVDGFQLIRTLSEQFDEKTFRCCVVTGMTPAEIEKRGQLPKDCPILGKPINFAELEKLVSDAFSDIATNSQTARNQTS